MKKYMLIVMLVVGANIIPAFACSDCDDVQEASALQIDNDALEVSEQESTKDSAQDIDAAQDEINLSIEEEILEDEQTTTKAAKIVKHDVENDVELVEHDVEVEQEESVS